MCTCVGYSVHVEVRGQLAVFGSLLLPLWDLGIKVRDLRLGGVARTFTHRTILSTQVF